ncbi:MAG TPA: carbohydrate-binding family 9-like protein [Daejeonella sp.]
MKQLEIPYLDLGLEAEILAVSSLLASEKSHYIDKAPWPEYPYKPRVSFTIAYGVDCLFLKYHVLEKEAMATCYTINDPVYKDSCVEFFIAFDDNGYYNLEVNCIGTCLLGYGAKKDDRELLHASTVSKIRSKLTFFHATPNGVLWELFLVIPFEVFTKHNISSLKGRQCAVNFYKCGDDLPEPHFISWNFIGSDTPNFHLPVYFGKATFI